MQGDPPIDMAWRGKSRRFLRGLAKKRREDGLTAAAVLAVRWGVAFAHKQLSALRDRWYDARLGVDTVADIPGLERPAQPHFDDAVYYARISPRVFAKLMRDLQVDAASFSFVDLGCGKGAAMLLALDNGFRSVVGVELNDRLASIAESNVKKWAAGAGRDGRASVDVIRGDVVDFRFPPEPSVIFMYNPFGIETLDVVLKNLAASIDQHPRAVVIAYVSPWHAHVLDALPLFERLPSRSARWAVFRSLAASE